MAEYTPEHLETVKRINKCKDYYEILGITKDATDSEIRKAYKKRALQFHPDKNKCPGAAEAFRKICNSAAILTDVEQRRQYDADATDYIYVRREQDSLSEFVKLLPIILAIALSIFLSPFVFDPPYSLQPNSKYPVARRTANLKVNYYVKENFALEFQGSVRGLEMSVEEEYISNLRRWCKKEKNHRNWMILKALNFGNKRLLKQARSIKMQACEKLEAIKNC